MKASLAAALVLVVALAGCSQKSEIQQEVVIYTSVDDVFARPVADRFQAETGIEVKLVSDTEETKSTGLLNRLIAEKNRPQADVFWSGDPVRAAILKSRGISAPYRPLDGADRQGRFSDPEGHWAALSARARVIIYNTNRVVAGQEPTSLRDFLSSRWKGQACLANPLFGTTSMHAAALFDMWGDESAKEFFEALQANDVAMLSSNGEVKRRVAAGDFAWGLTDTDDASVAVKEGQPIGVVFPDQDGIGTLIIPNAAVLVANGPNPVKGKQFIDYLMSSKVEQSLAESEAAQMPLRPGVDVPTNVRRLDQIKAMTVDYAKLGELLEQLSKGYLRQWVDENLRG